MRTTNTMNTIEESNIENSVALFLIGICKLYDPSLHPPEDEQNPMSPLGGNTNLKNGRLTNLQLLSFTALHYGDIPIHTSNFLHGSVPM
jgi:hypothetical protein